MMFKSFCKNKRKKPDDSIIRQGLQIDRFGKNILVNIHPSKEQQERAKTILGEMRRELPSKIKEGAKELEERIQEFYPIDLISVLSLINIFNDPETYKEYSDKGNPASVEYLTLLCLKKPLWRGKKPFLTDDDIKGVISKVEQILSDTKNSYLAEHIKPGQNEKLNSVEEFRYRSKLYELFCRNPGYPHHLCIVLKDVFSYHTIEKWMREKLGVKIDEIVEFSNAIPKMMADKLYERQKKAIKDRNQLLKELKLYKLGKWDKGECPEDLLKELARYSRKEAVDNIRGLGFKWIYLGLGDTFSFTANELAEKSRQSPESAKSFLDLFSLTFGSIQEDFCVPSPTHPLRITPIIHYADRYVCSVPHLLLWSIRPRLETLLNPESGQSINKDPMVWENYQSKRAEYVEQKALELLGSALRTDECFHSLAYKCEKNGSIENAELDGLILLDNALLLIECKSGGVKDPTKRGAPKSMETDLKNLIEDSHDQALRAENYIKENARPSFDIKTGVCLVIDKKHIDKIFMITVNLESLDVFTPALYELSTLGIIKGEEYPWAVSLLDLFVICDLVEFPVQLIHFVIRRLRLNQLRMTEASDELDWYGHYLSDGLYFDDMQGSGLDHISLMTYTTSMDDYYFYMTGQRLTPAPKPAQRMPTSFSALIKDLEDQRPRNYLDIGCALLDLGGAERERLCDYLRKLDEKAKRDGKIHDLSLYLKKGETIITYMCCVGSTEQELTRNLTSYGLLKKYQMKSKLWIGLGSVLGVPNSKRIWLVIKGEWAQDPKLDGIVRDYMPMMSLEQMDRALKGKE